MGYPEVKMQQVPPAVGFPQLTVNLVRQGSQPCDPAADALTQEELGDPARRALRQ